MDMANCPQRAPTLAVRILSEDTLTVSQAAGLLPGHRANRRMHPSAVVRLITAGSRRPGGGLVRLEAVRIGGRWVTSFQALERFAAALTPVPDVVVAPTPRSPGRRRRQAERAEAELRRLRL